RRDEVTGMPSERYRNPACVGEREIVTLTDVIEAEELHHDVMDRVRSGLNEGEAMMARIDVQEAGDEWFGVIVGESKAERGAIERHQGLQRFRPVDVEHDVTQSQGTGAKARNTTSRAERLGRRFTAVEQFQPVADRIASVIKSATWRSSARARLPCATSMRLLSRCAANASSALASAISQPKKPMPSPPSAWTTIRCLRSSMRKASVE